MRNLSKEKKIYPLTSGTLIIKENAYNSNKFFVKDIVSHKSGFANKDLVNLLLLCDGTQTLNEIYNKLKNIYSESEKQIYEKIKNSLRYLEEQGYIKYAIKPLFQPITFHKKTLPWSLDVVYLELTDSCNLSCIYCYAQREYKKNTTLRTENVFSLLEELAKLGVLKIIFTGGEPLLHKDAFKIFQYTKNLKMGFKLYTNGTQIDEYAAMQLKELNPESVAISLDSYRAEIHNKIAGEKCFSNVVRGIKLLKMMKIPLRINCAILKGINDKFRDIKAKIDFFLSLGANEIVIGPIMSYGEGEKHKDLILPLSKAKPISSIIQKKMESIRAYRKKTSIPLKFSAQLESNEASLHSNCGIGTYACCISANGDVFPCPLLKEQKFLAGNIFETKLEQTWRMSNIFKFFRTHNVANISECQKCPEKYKCSGGCKARALMYNGNLNSTDPWRCSFLKESK